MAILKPVTRAAAKLPKPLRRVEVKLSEAEIASRQMLVAGAKVKVLPTVGKPLRCQKWYQADYRSATPKGLELKSAKVRGQCERWGVK